MTLCISEDNLTISTCFKNGDVLFSWDNLEKKYYDVKINNQTWNRTMNESKFTVKDALKYDRIKITVRADGSSTYNKLTYNGELNSCCLL